LTEDLEVDMYAIPKENEKVVGYFAFMRLANGFEKTVFWTKERVQAHGKKYSQSYNSKFSPWQSDFDAMGRKTVLKHMLSTYAPLSTELQEAIVADNEDSTIQGKNEIKDVTQEPVAETLDGILGAPVEDVPNHDQETGEVLEEVSLFEGNTTNVKEFES